MQNLQNLHNILMVLARYSVTMHHDLMHKSQFGCCDPRRGRQLARMHNPGNALLHYSRLVEMMKTMTMTMMMTMMTMIVDYYGETA